MKHLVNFILESGKNHTGSYSFKQTVRYILTERIPEAMNTSRVKDLFSFIKWGMSSKKHNEFNRENPVEWFQELCYNIDAPDGGFLFDVDACYQDGVLEKDGQGKYEFTNKAARIFNDMYAHVKKHGLGGSRERGAAKDSKKVLKAKFDNNQADLLMLLEQILYSGMEGVDDKVIRKALGLKKGQAMEEVGIDPDGDVRNSYNKAVRLLMQSEEAVAEVLAAAEL